MGQKRYKGCSEYSRSSYPGQVPLLRTSFHGHARTEEPFVVKAKAEEIGTRITRSESGIILSPSTSRKWIPSSDMEKDLLLSNGASIRQSLQTCPLRHLSVWCPLRMEERTREGDYGRSTEKRHRLSAVWSIPRQVWKHESSSMVYSTFIA